MNILTIIKSVDPRDGGPVEGVVQLGESLVSAGHRVEVASLDAPGAAHSKNFALPLHPLGPTCFEYAFSARFTPWLRANRAHYDAVIVNGIWQFHSFATWRTLRNSSTPYFLYTHGMLDPWFKKRYPVKHLKKWIYWPWAEYRVLRDARAVLFTSEEERMLARSSFWLYRCNEVVVSYGTAGPKGDLSSEKQEFLARYPELRGMRLALFMGRIHPKKGCDLLIDAFARVMCQRPEWHLVIAGPDQVGWKKRLVDMSQRLGVESRVTWTGMVSGAMKWGAMCAAEIFVLPSHQESFGVAVAEALGAGVPTLISNKVNTWREIEADGGGRVSEDTLKGTCDLLQWYVDLPDDKQMAMRQAARTCFRRRFEIKKAAERLNQVLSKVTRLN